jgi:hypothetical protein
MMLDFNMRRKNNSRLIRIVLFYLIIFSALIGLGLKYSPSTPSRSFCVVIFLLFILILGIGLPIFLGDKGLAALPQRHSHKSPHILTSSLLGLFIFLFVGITGMVFSLIPTGKIPSVFGIVFVWGTSFLIALSGVLNRLYPKWYWQAFVAIGFTNLMISEGVYGLGFGQSIYFAGAIAIVLLLYIVTWLLPIINLGSAKAMSEELMGPRSRLTHLAMVCLILLAPSTRLLGAIFGIKYFMIFFGLDFSLLTILFSQLSSYQIWSARLRSMLQNPPQR